MKNSLLILLLLSNVFVFSQEALSEVLLKHNTHSIPYISVQELAMPATKAIIIDAREPDEFAVSHIKNAIHVGFNDFKVEDLQQKITNRNQAIVVYCSLGIRSETIGEKLKKAGYNNVKNLYGGIFEWKNNNFELYNTLEKRTDSIHAFNESWSTYLKNGIKVYNAPIKLNLKKNTSF
ncbi:rhodanese-like domain-containing protein [Bizionia gelidisalsuginis]|uniref:Rhodanese-like domain-containing protein n=2 Tax=Bizionia TaxID=283785 RepID=A0A8H2LEV4_9FLAO|nr:MULTISPECIES: rhodanese-like domain-containing protein [Bizionia]TYB78127.1 rhodanese-like domain-containing protein [Bizionia saleffrena]TYC12109.1 rhodanese-like domain-containing protein [Bizionia gelidisalsuginis]